MRAVHISEGKYYESQKERYMDTALKILDLESKVSNLCENIKFTPYGQLTPLMDNIMMTKLELHKLRNEQKDIEFKFRTVGGLPI